MMMKVQVRSVVVVLVMVVVCMAGVVVCSSSGSRAKGVGLRKGFYKHTCPDAEAIVRWVVKGAVEREARMAGSLLRLHFHDCFVQGCDASLLLTSNATFLGEQDATPNKNSVRGFNVVDDIKEALEHACPATVSCADILALAARDSVVLSGGPWYSVLLGRRDSLTASAQLAEQFLPSFLSDVPTLVAKFEAVGLSQRDMVALSGAHTIGKANCFFVQSRLSDPTSPSLPLDASFRTSLQKQCPQNTTTITSSSTFLNLDVATPTLFDNAYYKNLLKGKGLLHSDQVLFSTTLALHYAQNQASFFSDFVHSIIRMGNIHPLLGDQGQIRKQCGVVNA